MGVLGLELRDFLLGHPEPRLFDRPQCVRFPRPLFVFYRLVVAAWVLAIITFNQAYKIHRTPNPFTYLTNWNFMMQAFALSVKAVIACYRASLDRCRTPGPTDEDDDEVFTLDDDHMTWYLKFEWVLHNISSCVPIVTLNYWSGFQQQKESKMSDPFFLFFTVQTHGLTAVLALVDIIVGAIPSRVLHFYHPVAFLIVYYAFMGVYYVATDGGLIYPYMDWGQPRALLLQVFIILLMATAVHLFVCMLKTAQSRWCCHPGGSVSRRSDEKTRLLSDEDCERL